MDAQFDAPMFDLDNQKVEKLHRQMAAESAAMDNLAAAGGKGDKTEIMQAAMAIKPPFVKLYLLFGDF